MSKELEALKTFGDIPFTIGRKKVYKKSDDEVTKDYQLLLKSFTPPTPFEVCQAFGEHIKNTNPEYEVMVVQENRTQFILLLYKDDKLHSTLPICDLTSKGNVVFHPIGYNFPPNVIMTACRFYESRLYEVLKNDYSINN